MTWLTAGYMMLYLTMICPTTSLRLTKCSPFRKLRPLYGIFDAFQQKLNEAFANDAEYTEKEIAGRKVISGINVEKRMNNARKIEATDFVGSYWEMDINVKGIAMNDESNDLYAAKSAWGKQDGVSFKLYLEILKDGVLKIEENGFTASGVNGKWQLDEKDITLAFALPCIGLERTIKTKGTITNVMGGDDTDKTTSSYFVPQGTCLIQSTVIMNTSGLSHYFI